MEYLVERYSIIIDMCTITAKSKYHHQQCPILRCIQSFLKKHFRLSNIVALIASTISLSVFKISQDLHSFTMPIIPYSRTNTEINVWLFESFPLIREGLYCFTCLLIDYS